MSDKKVLIITYYWPPSGGSGVQRWLKFVKYLPQFGWLPYVFTPENPSFEIRDESLLKDVPVEAEVIKLPIWEPYNFFFKLFGIFSKSGKVKVGEIVSSGNKTLFQKIISYIRGNFLIPDPKVFWVGPAVSFLNDFLKERRIDTIITTGPPHSMHLIGLRLKKKNPSLRWIADFRDPWSEWGFLDSLHTGRLARSIHKRLETRVLQSADEIVTITPFYVNRFEILTGKKISLLTNGYDDEDFVDFNFLRPDKFTIRHVGIVNEKCDPRPFMLAFETICSENSEMKSNSIIEFVGEVHPQFRNFVESNKTLRSVTRFVPTVPHEELINLYKKSSVLLLILNGYKNPEGYLPGKLFEYVATGLPILGIGPVEGDAAHVIRHHQNGLMTNGSDYSEIKNFLSEHYLKWNDEAKYTTQNSLTEYSRRNITEKLTELFER